MSIIMQKKRIGYIGPGRMGSGIIKNLLKNGLAVTIFEHRKGLDVDDLTKLGATLTDSLQKLAAENNVIMLTVPSSREVEHLVLGPDGLLHYLNPYSVVIDLSTSLPSSTRMIATELGKKKIEMLDAAMTGTPIQAEKGEINLMVGGKKEIYQKCLDIFRSIAKNIFYVGNTSSGHIVKLINNFLFLTNIAAISEILPLATKAGVDIDALYSVILVSGGNSRAFEGNLPSICRRVFDVLFTLRMARKDLTYVEELGREYDVPLPIASNILQVFDLAVAYGLGEENTSALVKMWEDIAGVTVQAQGKQIPNEGKK